MADKSEQTKQAATELVRTIEDGVLRTALCTILNRYCTGKARTTPRPFGF